MSKPWPPRVVLLGGTLEIFNTLPTLTNAWLSLMYGYNDNLLLTCDNHFHFFWNLNVSIFCLSCIFFPGIFIERLSQKRVVRRKISQVCTFLNTLYVSFTPTLDTSLALIWDHNKYPSRANCYLELEVQHRCQWAKTNI